MLISVLHVYLCIKDRNLDPAISQDRTRIIIPTIYKSGEEGKFNNRANPNNALITSTPRQLLHAEDHNEIKQCEKHEVNIQGKSWISSTPDSALIEEKKENGDLERKQEIEGEIGNRDDVETVEVPIPNNCTTEKGESCTPKSSNSTNIINQDNFSEDTKNLKQMVYIYMYI